MATGMWNKILLIFTVAAIISMSVIMGYTMLTGEVGEEFTEFYITGPESMVKKYPMEFTLDNGEVVRVRYIDVKYVETGNPEEIAESTGRATLVVVNHEQERTEYTIKMTIMDNPAQMETNEDGEWKQYDELSFALNDEESQDYKIGFAPQEICGSTRLTSPALPGEKELAVESVSNLQAGDYILVGDAGNDELVQIATINRSQSMFTLVAGLKYNHEAEYPVVGQQKVEFALYKSGEDEPYATLHLWIHVKEQ